MIKKMKFNLSEAQLILSKTPLLLSQLLSELPEKWVKNNEGENTWSPYDIVGHLIHGEKTDWITRAKIILENSPDNSFEPFDRFAQFENSKGKTIDDLLGEFGELRSKNLEELKELNIGLEQLNLEGIHPDFGTVTLKELLSTWVVHDFNHINQITRVMASNYKQEVGPWIQYISFMNR